MYVIRWFLLKSCIFGVFISVTGASVLLETFDRETTYLKGSNVTLVCTITPYNNEMTWYVDNQLYADCFLGNCGPSLNKTYTFKFTFDETAGVFKLNIDSVDSSHAELSFACDDGNVRETISFNVTTVTSEHNNDNGDSPVSTGGIIGIVISIVVVIFVACLIIFVYRWRKRKGQIKERKGQIEEIKALLLRLLNLQRNNRSHVQELLEIKGLSEEIKIEAKNRLSTMNWGDKIKLYKDINEEEWSYVIDKLTKERDTIIDEQISMTKQGEKRQKIFIEEKVKITKELEQMRNEGTTDEQRSMKERAIYTKKERKLNQRLAEETKELELMNIQEKERKLNQRLAEKTKELELMNIQEGKRARILKQRLDVITGKLHSIKNPEQEVNKETFEKSILQDPARYKTFLSFIVREIVEKEKCFDDIIKRALDKDPDAFEKMKSEVETKLKSK